LKLKKISCILLLAILLLQAGGMLFIFKVQQFFAQYEMKQTMLNDHIKFQEIILSLKDYSVDKLGADEVSVKGKLYDVKSVTVEGSKVVLLAVNDNKEENILAAMKKFISQPDHRGEKIPDRLLQLFLLNYLSPGVEFSYFIPSSSAHSFYSFIPALISKAQEISTPPPRLA
jgi:hypothetical protein